MESGLSKSTSRLQKTVTGFEQLSRIRVLIVTSEWPSGDGDVSGIHVVNQVNALRKHGLQVDLFHFRGQKSLIRYFKAIWNLRSIDLTAYALIHSHHGQAGFVSLFQRKCPVVVTFHGSDLQGIQGTNKRLTFAGIVLRSLSRVTGIMAEEVIVVSEHLAKSLPARSYAVIPAGVRMDLFRPMPVENARKILGWSNEQRFVLFVGDPQNPIKRFPLAEEAVERLKLTMNVDLVTANRLSQAEVCTLMNACDALLLTSRHEGSPNAIKEALACNLPVVSVDVGDVRERVKNISGCAICPNDDPRSIAGALEQVLKNPKRVDGRRSVENLDEEMLASRVIEIYNQVISKHQKKSKG